MNENKKVSIIIPMYNAEGSILNCLTPLLDQDYKNIEIIVVDDGSTDNSYNICMKLSEIHSEIKVIHQENQGSGAARNTGVSHSSGAYAYFPDADDFVEPSAFGILVDEMERTEADMIVFGFNTLKNGHAIAKKFERQLFDGNEVRENYNKFGYSDFEIMGAPWNKFFRMRLIKENHIEFPTLRRHQDEVFIMRYVNYVKNVQFVEDVLFNHYPNDISLKYQKYPFNYFEIATELKNFRLSIAYNWNENNTDMLSYFAREYYRHTIESMELLFNPKWQLSDEKKNQIVLETIEKFYKEAPTLEFSKQNIYPYDDRFHDAFTKKDSRYILKTIPIQLKKIAYKEKLKKLLKKA